DDGNELPPGEVGTIWMKMGDRKFEYHEDEMKTKEAWNDAGFFTVGDAGYLDEAGYLFLCDRKNDMIISGGVNIYPAEIEKVLHEHPAVADVAVFGVPDEEWGEQVKAVVEPLPGHAPGAELAEAIRAFARGRLAGYKVPRSVDFVDALPRTPAGKVRVRELREPYWQGRPRRI
ncbi:MAG: AMP-binding protein, partial [Myxococcota bacterium]|nr:AMP-binding protein [Myxococcota bacterium]